MSLLPAHPGANATFTATLGYVVPDSDRPLGAYLLEIRFNPSRLRYVTGDASTVADRVVNASNADTGNLVLAGARGAGFVDGILFRGTFEALAPDVTSADLMVGVREAHDIQLQNLLK
jgi:hypothetical protein